MENNRRKQSYSVGVSSNAAFRCQGGSVVEWLACWTQAQKGPGSNRSRDAVAGPILSVFPALIVHSELKSVHPGFPVAFIF